MSRRGESPFSLQPKIPCSSAGAPLQDDAAAGAITWPPRCYSCSFCGREFNSAQALGGHMNIHRRDRARLRTVSDHHSSNTPHHDWPPTAITDHRNTPQPLSIYSGNQLHPAPLLQAPASRFQEYCQGPSSSITYNPSPIGHISGAAPPFKVQGSTMMIPAADQRPFDYNSFPGPPSSQIRGGNSANSSAPSKLDPHSPRFPKSSSLSRISRELQSTPVADPSNCGSAEATTCRASHESRLGVAGADTYNYSAYRAHELIQFKELAEVHSRRRSQYADVVTSTEELLNDSIERPCSIAKDSDSVHGAPAAVPTSPKKDSLACLDLELRLGRRSSLSVVAVATAAAAEGNCMHPSPPRRPP